MEAFFLEINRNRLGLSLVKTAAGEKNGLILDRQGRKQGIILDAVFKVIVAELDDQNRMMGGRGKGNRAQEGQLRRTFVGPGVSGFTVAQGTGLPGCGAAYGNQGEPFRQHIRVGLLDIPAVRDRRVIRINEDGGNGSVIGVGSCQPFITVADTHCLFFVFIIRSENTGQIPVGKQLLGNGIKMKGSVQEDGLRPQIIRLYLGLCLAVQEVYGIKRKENTDKQERNQDDRYQHPVHMLLYPAVGTVL